VLSYFKGPICTTFNASDSDCTKSLGLLTLDISNSKFIVDPNETPLKINSATLGVYDHTLLSTLADATHLNQVDHEFKISVTSVSTSAFKAFYSLPD
jgi:hypothetical protein